MRGLPYVAFFLSGASSLIFQALWTRMLHHTFGATSVAMSSVLTAFMAGLGLGAHLFGRRVKRFSNPLRIYALCELCVAAMALVIPLLVDSQGPLAHLNGFLRERLGASSFTFMFARFLCVLPLLLLPTTLMGGTLPLLAQHFVVREQAHGNNANAGALYAVNTFGAVAGSLMGSFVLMPAVGVRATNGIAVGINAALGLFILALSRRSRADEPALGGALMPQASASVSARKPALLRAAAAFAFACSGACAMAYEVVWSRALSMAIGSSLQAFALILVTFLIGIAGGSALLSSFLSETRSGVRTLLALSGSAVALCALALSPAAVLSNLTLAALAFLACVALVGARCAGLLRELKISEALDPELCGALEARMPRAGRALLLLPSGIALFEAARFALHRSVHLGVSLHGYLPYITAAVVLCLCAFLWLSSAFIRTPFRLACAVQLFVAFGTWVTYIFQDEIPYTFARLVSSVADPPSHVGTVRFFMFFTASLCTLPPTLGMGAMFPITLALWNERREDVGADVGRVYAANTLGSILGAWLPGFVLLPLFGMQRTLDAGITLNALVACLMAACAFYAREPLGRAGVLTSGASAGFTLLMLWTLLSPEPPLRWNLSHMTLGAFRVSLAKELLDVQSWGKSDLVYYRDGLSTTVSVERWGLHLSLKNNGKVDASNGDDMPTQIMVAAYPLLLHTRGARDLDVAVVGFGSGVTVGAALQFPVRHVEAIELERAVVEAAVDFFADVSHLGRKRADFPYVDEPRLTLYSDDGRNFLSSTKHSYDVIISEPSNPWITGVSDLFTTEHFRITKQRLSPGGVYCQWVQLYEMSPESIKTIYRTFASQFRYVLAFAAEELSSDTILLGSDSPLPLDVAHVARAFEDAKVRDELERAYVHSPFDVYSRILFASRDEVLQFAQRELRRKNGALKEALRATGSGPCKAPDCMREPAPLNSDDNMLIELSAPSDLIGFARYEGYLSLFYGRDWPYGGLSGRLRGIDSQSERADMALALLAQGRKEQARAFAAALDSSDPGVAEARETVLLLLAGDEASQRGEAPEATPEPPSPGPYLSEDARRAFDLAVREAEARRARGDFAGALRMITGPNVPSLLLHQSGPGFHYLYALLLYRAADGDRAQLKRAAFEFEELIRKDALYASVHPELYYFLARALDGAASFDKAVRNMRAYVRRRADAERGANETAHRE